MKIVIKHVHYVKGARLIAANAQILLVTYIIFMTLNVNKFAQTDTLVIQE